MSVVIPILGTRVSYLKSYFLAVSLWLSCGVMILTSQLASAAPSQIRNPGTHPKFEARQRQLQEFRANRQAQKLAAQSTNNETEPPKAPANAGGTSPSLSATVQQNQGNIERDANPNKLNRLTPEERQALRRQIREARREIYLQRTQ